MVGLGVIVILCLGLGVYVSIFFGLWVVGFACFLGFWCYWFLF